MTLEKLSPWIDIVISLSILVGSFSGANILVDLAATTGAIYYSLRVWKHFRS